MHPGDLFAQWRRLSESGLNNRAAAGRLGVSEAQLLASACGTMSQRLVPDAGAILDAVRLMGRSKFVLRNDFAVLERPGEISRVGSPREDLLEVQAGTVRLRLSPGKVASAFALVEHDVRGAKRSLQLFDASGVTVLKLVFREPSGEAFDSAVKNLRHCRQSTEETVDPRSHLAGAEPGICRAAALGSFLQRAAELGVALDIHVCNAGASLETRAPIRRVKRSEHAPWINVLDPGLELHLYEERIRSVRLERESPDGGWLHWLADDGSRAFSVRPAGGFEALAEAAQENAQLNAQLNPLPAALQQR